MIIICMRLKNCCNYPSVSHLSDVGAPRHLRRPGILEDSFQISFRRRWWLIAQAKLARTHKAATAWEEVTGVYTLLVTLPRVLNHSQRFHTTARCYKTEFRQRLNCNRRGLDCCRTVPAS